MTSPTLSNLAGLIGLTRQHGVDIKPTLLRVLTDFYVSKPDHAPEEHDQYVELALRLIQGIEWTVVNGQVLMEHGQHTGAYPGKVAPARPSHCRQQQRFGYSGV